MAEYIPIVVAYKTQYGKKVKLRKFTNLRTPDVLLTNRTNKLPKNCTILEIGVGSGFEERFKKKYG